MAVQGGPPRAVELGFAPELLQGVGLIPFPCGARPGLAVGATMCAGGALRLGLGTASRVGVGSFWLHRIHTVEPPGPGLGVLGAFWSLVSVLTPVHVFGVFAVSPGRLRVPGAPALLLGELAGGYLGGGLQGPWRLCGTGCDVAFRICKLVYLRRLPRGVLPKVLFIFSEKNNSVSLVFSIVLGGLRFRDPCSHPNLPVLLASACSCLEVQVSSEVS